MIAFDRPSSTVAAVVAALLLSACASSAPTRYFTLEAIGPFETQPTPTSRYAGPPIELRSVQVPPAMDRLEMVRELSAGELALREFDHWAAPLGRLAKQTLTEDLSHRLPADRLIFPGAGGPSVRAALTVDVLSFHLIDDQATMVVSWAIRWPAADSGTPDMSASPTATSVESMRLSVPANATANGLERAWSDLLAQAADRIAATLNNR
jgi:uncharacterized lipoprotein YmbA